MERTILRGEASPSGRERACGRFTRGLVGNSRRFGRMREVAGSKRRGRRQALAGLASRGPLVGNYPMTSGRVAGPVRRRAPCGRRRPAPGNPGIYRRRHRAKPCDRYLGSAVGAPAYVPLQPLERAFDVLQRREVISTMRPDPALELLSRAPRCQSPRRHRPAPAHAQLTRRSLSSSRCSRRSSSIARCAPTLCPASFAPSDQVHMTAFPPSIPSTRHTSRHQPPSAWVVPALARRGRDATRRCAVYV